MDNAFQELLYQILAVTLTVSLTIITAYVRNYLKTKIDVTKYGYTNKELDALLTKAVIYAEQKGKEYAKNSAKETDKNMSGSTKFKLARDFINKIDPNIIDEYGDKLTELITAKVGEQFGTSIK